MKAKHIYLSFLSTTLIHVAYAQDALPAVPFFQQLTTEQWAFGTIIALMLATILVLATALKKVMKAYRLLLNPSLKEQESVAIHATEKEKLKKESLWKKFDRKILTRAVPVEREKDVLIEHAHDGIYELDNSLPPWWKYGFYFTILFAVIYMISYHITGSGKLQTEEYIEEMNKAEAEKAARLMHSADLVNESNVTVLTDASAVQEGKDIYIKNCAACHLPDGGGLVGPNLTDEFWIHGGSIKDIFRTVESGVPEKGMIAWKAQLSPKQIQRVASFIVTLKGTRPATPKEPQGEKWTDTQMPADTATVQLSAAN